MTASSTQPKPKPRTWRKKNKRASTSSDSKTVESIGVLWNALSLSQMFSATISSIDPSPFQPRSEFDRGALEKLARSIRDEGIIQPIVVRSGKGKRYELVVGERRLRAAKLAGLKEIPAVRRTLSDAEAARMTMAENSDRADLNPIEIATGYRTMIAVCGMSQQQLAQHEGCSQGQIANTLRLLRLPESWKWRVMSREISATQARMLVPLCKDKPALDRVERALKKLDGEGVTTQSFTRILEDAIREIPTEPEHQPANGGTAPQKEKEQKHSLDSWKEEQLRALIELELDCSRAAIVAVAKKLRIDLKRVWHNDRCGAMTESFFESRSRQQLLALGSELDVFLMPKDSRATLIAKLMAAGKSRGLPCPRELAK